MSSINEKRNIKIPEEYTRRELNALYREIPLKNTTSRLLRKYFNGMANLYGIIRLKKAYEIILSLSPSLVTEDEFLAFAEIARHECEDYFIMGRDELFTDVKSVAPLDREIIDPVLFDFELEPYIELRQLQQGKPYYIPTKKELLSYAGSSFGEETPEASDMMEFLTKQLKLDDEKATIVFTYIQFEIRCTTDRFSDVVERLENMGVCFYSRSDIERFTELYNQFNNTSRLQCNRGYTPNEMLEMEQSNDIMSKSIAFGSGIFSSKENGTMGANITNAKKSPELPSKAEKIGRNAPCPCGSGKKYKKCCGK